MTSRPAPLTSNDFIQSLIDAGILPADARIRHVMIDAKRGNIVEVHIRAYGDERLKPIASTLEGAKIVREGQT